MSELVTSLQRSGVTEGQLGAVPATCLGRAIAPSRRLLARLAGPRAGAVRPLPRGAVGAAWRKCEERVAECVGVAAAALVLGVGVVAGELLAVQFLHRQRGGEEPGARDAIGDPEVDGAVDWELDDVVG